MNVKGTKIKSLVDYYANMKDYPSKSSLAKFCEDYELNYNQWNAYIRETQAVGIKIIHQLMDIFPKLNLNWLLKNAKSLYNYSSDELCYNITGRPEPTNSIIR